jgi:mono/diheme cytochrome c family protein
MSGGSPHFFEKFPQTDPWSEEAMQTNRLLISLIAVIMVVGYSLIRTAQIPAQDEGNQDLIEEGARLYAENCAVCHGPEGQGRVGATLAKDWPSIRPDLQIEATIERGVPGSVMPAWSLENGGPLTDQQIDALVQYILSWETGGPITIFPTITPIPHDVLTPPADVEGDPNNGADLYQQNCSVCHGPEGEGRVGATLAKDWPSIRPDLQVKTTVARGVDGSVMPAWSQEFGGPLTDGQINDLVAFVLTWSTQENPPTITPAPTPAPEAGFALTTSQTWVILFLIVVVLVAGAAIAAITRR